MLRNHYGVETGTSGLIIQAQSREEILADKLVALALRPNRLKNRDLWDIGWLKQQGVELPLALLPNKINDRHQSTAEFLGLLNERKTKLQLDPLSRKDFIQEMRRFLPAHVVVGTVDNGEFWTYLTSVICAECDHVTQSLKDTPKPFNFKM